MRESIVFFATVAAVAFYWPFIGVLGFRGTIALGWAPCEDEEGIRILRFGAACLGPLMAAAPFLYLGYRTAMWRPSARGAQKPADLPAAKVL